jgi:1,4-dihydroxy-2-naphthoate octaprenyltransferase
MKHWIQAARLRTLPLSISGIIVGSTYAYHQGFSNWKIVVLALLTTLGLQILSNFANDYGDGVKGTDDNRIGEKRLVGSGVISAQQMKKAVIITSIITFIVALLLIFVAFGKENFVYSVLFILLGLLAIVAAIKYTVGNNAYGYSGFGDVFVFVFFGLVAVIGTHFLFTKTFSLELILPATTIGVLSMAVLNLNNMRDIENDKKSGKDTLVVKLGLKNAKKYHYALFFIGLVAMTVFSRLTQTSLFPILIVSVLFIKHIGTVHKATDYKDFDPELKKVALGTFALSLLFWLTLVFLG